MKLGVLIVMGSVNDLPKIEPALEVLRSLDIPFKATVAVVVGNLAADLAYAVVDPRIRL